MGISGHQFGAFVHPVWRFCAPLHIYIDYIHRLQLDPALFGDNYNLWITMAFDFNLYLTYN
jgi:hypothetical protein